MFLDKLYNEVVNGDNTSIDIDYQPSKYDITNFLNKTLTSGKPISTSFINHSDIISYIIPELKPCIGFKQNNKYHKHDVYEHLLSVTDYCDTNDFIVKLAALLHDVGKPQSYLEDEEGHGHFYGHPEVSYEICKNNIVNRLNISKNDKERLLELVRYHDIVISNNKKSINKLYRKLGESVARDWIILKEADLADHIFPNDKPIWFITRKEFDDTLDSIINDELLANENRLKINGNDIMNLLNIEEGKAVGEILSTLKNEVMLNKLSNDSNSLLKRAFELYSIIP